MTGFELEGGGLQLDFGRDFCDRHREPLRAEWPRGAGIALVLLFDAFAQDERVQAMAPRSADGFADAAALPRLVAECAPLCCFVGDEITAEIIAEALAGDGPRRREIRDRNERTR